MLKNFQKCQKFRQIAFDIYKSKITKITGKKKCMQMKKIDNYIKQIYKTMYNLHLILAII